MCDTDHGDTGRVEDGAVGAEGGGLAGPGLADDHVDAGARGGERADHRVLVVVEAWVRCEDLVDDPAWDASGAGGPSAGRAVQQFGFGGQQADGGVAPLD
jgi:hypothetical protein